MSIVNVNAYLLLMLKPIVYINVYLLILMSIVIILIFVVNVNAYS